MLNIFMRVAFILLIFLLICNIFAFILLGTTDTPITFSSILNKLSNAPTIDLSISQSVDLFKITADWGILNGLRDFINFFSQILGLIVWIGSVLVNLVIFVGYVLYLLGINAFSIYV